MRCACRKVGGGGGDEPLHGHDFSVTVRLECAQLDALGTVMDFHQIEAALEMVLGPWRNRNLNDCAPFRLEPTRTAVNPSAERIAEFIAQSLRPIIRMKAPKRSLRLTRVCVTEAEGCRAIWMAT